MSRQSPVLAVDLGGTHLRTALFANGERISAVRTIAHGASRERPLPVAELVSALREAMADVVVAGIGVSVAGTVERESGVVLVADNLGWSDVALEQALAAAFALPIAIETDTFCGAMAEARIRPAGGAVLYVAIGTGIGHAWIIDGRVWRGAREAATMFGHLVIDPHGPLCYCGARGCLCQYAAGPIVQNAAPAVLEQAANALALALAHALTLMNPDDVTLGGGAVTERWPDLDVLTDRVTMLLHPAVRPVRLRRSALAAGANLAGAAIAIADRICAHQSQLKEEP